MESTTKTETTFVWNPSCLRDVLDGITEQHRRGSTENLYDYYIPMEKHLTASEWCEFTCDMTAARDWIAAFTAEEFEDDMAAGIACLRVSGEGVNTVLLILMTGHDYAQCIGVEQV